MPHGTRTAGARTPRRLGFLFLGLLAGCQTGGKYLPPTKPILPTVAPSAAGTTPPKSTGLPPTVTMTRQPATSPVVKSEGFGGAKPPDMANPNSGNFTTPGVPGIPTSGGSLAPVNLAPPTPVEQMKPLDIVPPTASGLPAPTMTPPAMPQFDPPTILPPGPPGK